jgi:hypothetical protein
MTKTKITKEYAMPRFQEVIDSALEQKPEAKENIMKIWDKINAIPSDSKFWERKAGLICTLTIGREPSAMAGLLKNAFVMIRSGEAK